jgi:hypothetical protein
MMKSALRVRLGEATAAWGRLWGIAFAAGAIVGLVSCGQSEVVPESAPVQVRSEVERARPALLADEPWTFESVPGRAMRTASYRVFTTLPRGSIADQMPTFLEQAVTNYRTAIVLLPGPAVAMDTYLLSNRPQWQRLTKTLLGDAANAYLHIQRGGVAVGGRAMLYEIGPRDTFVIAAHEGWHQYTQRVMKDALPVWLDEGVATYMEGFRWSAQWPGEAEFSGWANLERYDTLRMASQANVLMSLEQIVNLGPGDLVQAGPDAALVAYAQMWALIHFLREGDEGEHAAGLRAMLSDAAAGKMSARVRREVGARAAEQFAARRAGADVLRVYLGKSAAAMEESYRAAIERIVELGGRDAIVAGKSPLAAGK